MGDAGDGGGATSGQARESEGRVFTMLENNPAVMTELAHNLGASKALSFYDVYSIYDADVAAAMLPRPVFALLTTIPLTAAWQREREAEDARHEWYAGSGAGEPVTWFKQTIEHGCGLIGLLHCVGNGLPGEAMIEPGSPLADLLAAAAPLKMAERAQLLKDSDAMYEASQAVAQKGDTEALHRDVPTGNHFVALVKGRDGHLWELEGSRKGPLDRGALAEDEDAFSERALQLGIKRLIDLQREGGGELRFSCIALAPSMD